MMFGRALDKARTNMYRNVSKVFPDATLDGDLLVGELYKGCYSVNNDEDSILAVCEQIFTADAPASIFQIVEENL